MTYVYSINDRVANAFNVPFCCPSDGDARLAVRSFLFQDPLIRNHAHSLALYVVGSFDDGKLEGFDEPVFLCNVDELVLPDEVEGGVSDD